MTIKIATWNVNSLRVRLPHILSWLEKEKPDVLALQETKVTNEAFPIDLVQKAGYQTIFCGQKSYNGVAIFSKTLPTNILTEIPDYQDEQKRFLCATISNLRIINLYVPNGFQVGSEKFVYKLEWLNNLTRFVEQEINAHQNIIILGDFNIAPDDIDVYDPTKWQGKVLVSEDERQAFKKLLSLGFQDSFRSSYPLKQHFSWWDYRLPLSRNLGMRIDHIITNIKTNFDCYIDRLPRTWERPSDHAPVILELH